MYLQPLTHLYAGVLVCSSVTFTCKGILFDLDGVLVDSTAAVARVWQCWAIEHGLPPERVIREAHGRRSIETIRELMPHLHAERENQIVEGMEIADREGVVALPGAGDLMRALPQERFAVVTSATRALAVARLSYAGLPVPERLVSADDVSEGKPSPKPYLQGACLLGLQPRECIVFEDTAAGIESAHRAGMRAIALTTTFSARELMSAEGIVASLAQIEMKVEDAKIQFALLAAKHG